MKRPPVTAKKPTQSPGAMLLDVRQGSALLGQDPRWVRRRVERKLLPHRKFGGRIYFLRSELEEFIWALPGTSLDEARQNLSIRSGDRGQR